VDDYNDDINNRLVLLNNVNTNLTETKNNILYYILGYIIRGIVNKLDCNSGINCLFKKIPDHNYSHSYSYTKFTDLKNKGGLISGSEDAYKIIVETEKLFLYHTNYLKKLNTINLNKIILRQIINKFVLDQYIFLDLCCENISILERPHKIVLITLLTNKFLSIRLKSYGKMFSTNILNPHNKRHKLTKEILFSNQ
jgi:hypothetical protein